MTSPGARWSGAASGLGVALGLTFAGLWLATADRSPERGDPGEPSANLYALSPQECTTECQSRQTDCILDCDGHVPCERRCTDVGRVCVERCRRADAGAGGGVSDRGGRAGSPGAASAE